MSRNYTRDQLKIATGKILLTLGWNSINSTPVEILTDILGNYLTQITRTTNSYANEFGCTQPSLDHLGLAFRDMGISVAELEEYVKYVNFGPPPTPVPKYPLLKEDHLNFLKPGSKEVVTRPVHIHEHLPPMHPLLEGTKNEEVPDCKIENPEEENLDNPQVFKKPADILPAEFKRPSFRREEEGSRPTREISSVMMTTSGFLSPAREGKLPESRTPITPADPVGPINPSSETVDLNKKPIKTVKKIENRKPKSSLVTNNDQTALEDKKKRMKSMTRVLKSKQNRLVPKNNTSPANALPMNDVTASPINPKRLSQVNKMNRTLAAARLKTEKLNTTITPITIKPVNASGGPQGGDNVDKLFTEPDKKKVNIFKKISNVKNEKNENVKLKKEQESRESSPDLIIDEPDEIVAKFTHLTGDVTIEPIPVPSKSPEKVDAAPYFDDDSQPGTPATPKTPEMISHSPPMIKEKRKRKDGRKIRKIQRIQSPHRLDGEIIDVDMERPKTPEAQVLSKMCPLNLPSHGPGPMPFPFHFGGPGLFPTNLTNPLFPSLAFPPMALPNFGQKPYLPPVQKNPINEIAIPIDNHKPPNSEKIGPPTDLNSLSPSAKLDKKNKEHKKDKKDKIKKKNKKDKIKNKAEKKKLKEEKKDKIKKEKKEKRKDKEGKEGADSPGVKITLKKIKSPSPRPDTPETRKLNIKPIIKKEEDEDLSAVEDRIKRETSPGLAKFSALVFGPPKPKPVNPPPTAQPAEATGEEEITIPPTKTGPGPGRPRIHPIKPKPCKPKKRRTPIKKDEDGNEVWICPACGRQDDGSPMIGCDGCDAWYHWVCVGIQVPPDDSEDWYCRHCLLKKNEDLQSDKQKKKRKKREKKEH